MLTVMQSNETVLIINSSHVKVGKFSIVVHSVRKCCVHFCVVAVDCIIIVRSASLDT